MNPEVGMFLKSTHALKDTFFEDAVIFITDVNASGAVGFVVNKLFNRRLNELEEFKYSHPHPMYEGGPVNREHLFFIHRRPDIIEEGKPVGNGLYVGGNFQQAVAGINEGSLLQTDIKIFIGYCGWDEGELEAEIAEGSWEVQESMNIFML